jgi:PTS system N-acetylgalactosamine-specific IIA component
MRYVILVSHGKFANGLNDALSMLAGNREDILSVGLENGKSVDEFVALFTEKVKDISTDDEVILLGDIIGGSPLTNATNVLVNKGIKTVIWKDHVRDRSIPFSGGFKRSAGNHSGKMLRL